MTAPLVNPMNLIGGMIRCRSCGFNVEPKEVRETDELSDNCVTCRYCEQEPKLKEAYRRGFNAGLDALSQAVIKIVAHSNLRKPPT